VVRASQAGLALVEVGELVRVVLFFLEDVLDQPAGGDVGVAQPADDW
jgi:hypothetical protein